jgi:uncharacterized protein
MAWVMNDTMLEIRDYVKTVFRQSGSHGFDHVLRVTSLCETIGTCEHADLNILIPAALFHDIARQLEQEEGTPHEVAGAQIAERYLKSIQYDEELIDGVSHAIQCHRYRTEKQPMTQEAQILSDADKLDAMGAVGIARTFLQAGERGGTIKDGTGHIEDKLLKLQSLLYTDSAREIAKRRHWLLEVFYNNLTDEMNYYR